MYAPWLIPRLKQSCKAQGMTLVSVLYSLSDRSFLGILVGHSEDTNKARPVMIFSLLLLISAVFYHLGRRLALL